MLVPSNPKAKDLYAVCDVGLPKASRPNNQQKAASKKRSRFIEVVLTLRASGSNFGHSVPIIVRNRDYHNFLRHGKSAWEFRIMVLNAQTPIRQLQINTNGTVERTDNGTPFVFFDPKTQVESCFCLTAA